MEGRLAMSKSWPGWRKGWRVRVGEGGEGSRLRVDGGGRGWWRRTRWRVRVGGGGRVRG